MPMARGYCAVCNQPRALKVDGTVRGHGYRQASMYDTTWCPGSHESPDRLVPTERPEVLVETTYEGWTCVSTTVNGQPCEKGTKSPRSR